MQHIRGLRAQGWFRHMRVQAGVVRERRLAERALPTVCEHLCTLLDAGIPLREVVANACEAERGLARRLLLLASEAIDEGRPLASAWADITPSLFQVLLVTGEHTGQLAHVLRRWRDYVEQRQLWRRELARAVSYPALLWVLGVGLLGFIGWVVLPAFDNLYRQLGMRPGAVTIVIEKGFHLVPLILGAGLVSGFVIAGWLLWYRQRSPNEWPAVRRRIPGWSWLRLERTRVFCQTLHFLLDAGVPIADALETLAAIGENWMVRAASEIRMRVLIGDPLPAAFVGDWDPALAMLLHWAEQTGDLAGALRRAEEVTRERLRQRVGHTLRLAEPALIGVMGLVVAVTMLVLFVPMYDLMTSIAGAGVH